MNVYQATIVRRKRLIKEKRWDINIGRKEQAANVKDL